MLGDDGQAQELTQETFLRAYRALLRGEEWANPRAWLYRTASRLAIDAYRRQRLLHWLPLSSQAAALTSTPAGNTPPAPVVAGRTPYTPLADPWEGAPPTAFYGAPARAEELAGP